MLLLKTLRQRLGDYWKDRRCRRWSERRRLVAGCRRVYLFHIRKTGGTSLIHMFLALAANDTQAAYERLTASDRLRLILGDKAYVGWHPGRIEQGHYFFAFSHRPYHQLHLPPETFTLTCLRDPAARVLSHYHMLLGFQRRGIAHPCMAEEGPWLGAGFDDFLTRIPRAHLLNQLYMFSAQFCVDEAAERIRSLHHVLMLDDFDASVEGLARKLSLPLRPRHIRKGDGQIDLPPRSAERLREMLRDEYELLERVTPGGATEAAPGSANRG